jgi:RNA recognition motif-containing protein
MLHKSHFFREWQIVNIQNLFRTKMVSNVSRFFTVPQVNVIRDHSKGGVSKGFGFVTMATPDQAHLAMEHLNGYILNGRPIQVSPKK